VKEFIKWWVKFNLIRDSPVKSPQLSHFKRWWDSRVSKNVFKPDLEKLMREYFAHINYKKIVKAFIQYHRTVSAKLPTLENLKAWWIRSKKKL